MRAKSERHRVAEKVKKCKKILPKHHKHCNAEGNETVLHQQGFVACSFVIFSSKSFMCGFVRASSRRRPTGREAAGGLLVRSCVSEVSADLAFAESFTRASSSALAVSGRPRCIFRLKAESVARLEYGSDNNVG